MIPQRSSHCMKLRGLDARPSDTARHEVVKTPTQSCFGAMSACWTLSVVAMMTTTLSRDDEYQHAGAAFTTLARHDDNRRGTDDSCPGYDPLVGLASRVGRLGLRWSEGPQWISDAGVLLFTDGMRTRSPGRGQRPITVFRQPSNNANGSQSTLRGADGRRAEFACGDTH